MEPALELVNTVVLTFCGTEYLLRGARKPTGEYIKQWSKLWMVLGVVNVGAWIVAGSENEVLVMVDGLVHLPWRLLHWLGSEVLFAGLGTVVGGLLYLGLVETGKVGDGNVLPKAQLGLMMGGLFVVSYSIAHVFQLRNIGVLAKAIIAFVAFGVVLFFDARRFRPAMTIGNFALEVAKAVIFSLPLFPLVAVWISFMLLILVSFVEKVLRMDPDFLNMPVYYLTLYGPFGIIYWQAKKACVSSTILG